MKRTAPLRHHLHTMKAPPKHHQKSTTPSRHLPDITKLPKHHRDTTKTPQGHDRDTKIAKEIAKLHCQTSLPNFIAVEQTRHQDTKEIPPRHQQYEEEVTRHHHKDRDTTEIPPTHHGDITQTPPRISETSARHQPDHRGTTETRL